jgi:hypothetical protein
MSISLNAKKISELNEKEIIEVGNRLFLAIESVSCI